MYRPPKSRKAYSRLQKSKRYKIKCVFCRPKEHEIIEQTDNFYVIENIFPYTIWDHFGVSSHLLLVPNRHVDGVGELNSIESSEYVKLLQKYEDQHYNYFARTPSNPKKTVAHQHTHLIKSDKREKKFLFYLRRPHIHWHD